MGLDETADGLAAEVVAPPTYQQATEARVYEDVRLADDGLVEVNLDSILSRRLSRLFARSGVTDNDVSPPEYQLHEAARAFPLKLNIVLQVVGSRGDIQPFIALGRALQKDGHRIRLATHAKFESLVHNAKLEFYSIGGDPTALMSYMVKNPGLVPSMQSIRAGDVFRNRDMMATILQGCWDSCIKPDAQSRVPFVADAIIANPPSFGHVHCAEALGIPLHIVFTMPWTATKAFRHPLARFTSTPTDQAQANYLSYLVVDWMTWQGIGDVINNFRRRLDLRPIPITEGPTLLKTLKIPHTYCWSPALVPRPSDWPAHVDVSGFFFQDGLDYTPPKSLEMFLQAGSPPVYIGFGSIVLDDASRISSIVLDAVNQCGVRAIISRGWSGLSGPDSPDVFWLDDCPHEWLFQHVSMVIHHGGAGTTACGLRFAKPTIIVPFFGDQGFWGAMVAATGAGPRPLQYKGLRSQEMSNAIHFCQLESTADAAARVALQMKREDGIDNAIRAFYANLPPTLLPCHILPDHPTAWALKVNGKRVCISKLAAGILVQEMRFKPRNLTRYCSNIISIENRRWDPVTATFSTLAGTAAGMVEATSGIFLEPYHEYSRSRKTNKAAMREASPVQSAQCSRNASQTTLGQRKTDESISDTASVNSYTTDASVSRGRLAAKMAAASGKSLGKVSTAYTRGILVGLPLATAEGFRMMPQLWGQEVKDYGKVTDWKMGAAVAGRSLVQGIGDGLFDVATLPVRGGREEGAWGAVKGVAKGTVSLATKTVAGTVGIVAYPGLGISRSLHSALHSATGNSVEDAQRDEGRWLETRTSTTTRQAVLDAYYDLMVNRA